MREFKVAVTSFVTVKLDETKFDDAFMAEFRANFYPFTDLSDHAEHIAQLAARNLIDHPLTARSSEFIEGYGPAREMGIAVRVDETSTTQTQ